MTWNKLIKVVLTVFVVILGWFSIPQCFIDLKGNEQDTFLGLIGFVYIGLIGLGVIGYMIFALMLWCQGTYDHILDEPIFKSAEKPSLLEDLKQHLKTARQSNDSEEILRLTNSIEIIEKYSR